MEKEIVVKKEKKFWGPDYGKIYPHLEGSTPYQKLIKTCFDYCRPKKGEIWLDVGCGSGALIEKIWRATEGEVGKIDALDLSPVMLSYSRLRTTNFNPSPKENQIVFKEHNLSNPLPYEDNTFNGIVANLVLPYVVYYQERYGNDALRGVLEEMYRVLKPGGRLIWGTPKKGVNFFWVFVASWKDMIDPRHLERLYYGPAILAHAFRIQKMGKRGEYHFLDNEKLKEMLKKIGFTNIEGKISFAKQAWVIKCEK